MFIGNHEFEYEHIAEPVSLVFAMFFLYLQFLHFILSNTLILLSAKKSIDLKNIQLVHILLIH